MRWLYVLPFTLFQFLWHQTIQSCFDGIKNGDEVYIDCGGSCNSCEYFWSEPLQIPPELLLINIQPISSTDYIFLFTVKSTITITPTLTITIQNSAEKSLLLRLTKSNQTITNSIPLFTAFSIQWSTEIHLSSSSLCTTSKISSTSLLTFPSDLTLSSPLFPLLSSPLLSSPLFSPLLLSSTSTYQFFYINGYIDSLGCASSSKVIFGRNSSNNSETEYTFSPNAQVPFHTKYNATTGKVLWVLPGTSSPNTLIKRMHSSIDNTTSRLYVSFYFTGTINPGWGAFNSDTAGPLLLSATSKDGTAAFAKSIGGIGSNPSRSSLLSSSPDGSSLLFSGTYNATTLQVPAFVNAAQNKGGDDAFLVSLSSSSGSISWVKPLGGALDDASLFLYSSPSLLKFFHGMTKCSPTLLDGASSSPSPPLQGVCDLLLTLYQVNSTTKAIEEDSTTGRLSLGCPLLSLTAATILDLPSAQNVTRHLLVAQWFSPSGSFPSLCSLSPSVGFPFPPIESTTPFTTLISLQYNKDIKVFSIERASLLQGTGDRAVTLTRIHSLNTLHEDTPLLISAYVGTGQVIALTNKKVSSCVASEGNKYTTITYPSPPPLPVNSTATISCPLGYNLVNSNDHSITYSDTFLTCQEDPITLSSSWVPLHAVCVDISPPVFYNCSPHQRLSLPFYRQFYHGDYSSLGDILFSDSASLAPLKYGGRYSSSTTESTNLFPEKTLVQSGTPSNFTAADFSTEVIVPIGVYDLELTVTDEEGNSASCLQELEIYYDIPPVLTCPGRREGETTISRPATVTVAVEGESDYSLIYSNNYTNVASEEKTMTFSLPIGEYAIEVTATDPYGNSASCIVPVVVSKTLPRVLSCPGTGLTLRSPLAGEGVSEGGVEVAISVGKALDEVYQTLPLPTVSASVDRIGLQFSGGEKTPIVFPSCSAECPEIVFSQVERVQALYTYYEEGEDFPIASSCALSLFIHSIDTDPTATVVCMVSTLTFHTDAMTGFVVFSPLQYLPLFNSTLYLFQNTTLSPLSPSPSEDGRVFLNASTTVEYFLKETETEETSSYCPLHVHVIDSTPPIVTCEGETQKIYLLSTLFSLASFSDNTGKEPLVSATVSHQGETLLSLSPTDDLTNDRFFPAILSYKTVYDVLFLAMDDSGNTGNCLSQFYVVDKNEEDWERWEEEIRQINEKKDQIDSIHLYGEVEDVSSRIEDSDLSFPKKLILLHRLFRLLHEREITLWVEGEGEIMIKTLYSLGEKVFSSFGVSMEREAIQWQKQEEIELYSYQTVKLLDDMISFLLLTYVQYYQFFLGRLDLRDSEKEGLKRVYGEYEGVSRGRAFQVRDHVLSFLSETYSPEVVDYWIGDMGVGEVDMKQWIESERIETIRKLWGVQLSQTLVSPETKTVVIENESLFGSGDERRLEEGGRRLMELGSTGEGLGELMKAIAGPTGEESCVGEKERGTFINRLFLTRLEKDVMSLLGEVLGESEGLEDEKECDERECREREYKRQGREIVMGNEFFSLCGYSRQNRYFSLEKGFERVSVAIGSSLFSEESAEEGKTTILGVRESGQWRVDQCQEWQCVFGEGYGIVEVLERVYEVGEFRDMARTLLSYLLPLLLAVVMGLWRTWERMRNMKGLEKNAMKRLFLSCVSGEFQESFLLKIDRSKLPSSIDDFSLSERGRERGRGRGRRRGRGRGGEEFYISSFMDESERMSLQALDFAKIFFPYSIFSISPLMSVFSSTTLYPVLQHPSEKILFLFYLSSPSLSLSLPVSSSPRLSSTIPLPISFPPSDTLPPSDILPANSLPSTLHNLKLSSSPSSTLPLPHQKKNKPSKRPSSTIRKSIHHYQEERENAQHQQQVKDSQAYLSSMKIFLDTESHLPSLSPPDHLPFDDESSLEESSLQLSPPSPSKEAVPLHHLQQDVATIHIFFLRRLSYRLEVARSLPLSLLHSLRSISPIWEDNRDSLLLPLLFCPLQMLLLLTVLMALLRGFSEGMQWSSGWYWGIVVGVPWGYVLWKDVLYLLLCVYNERVRGRERVGMGYMERGVCVLYAMVCVCLLVLMWSWEALSSLSFVLVAFAFYFLCSFLLNLFYALCWRVVLRREEGGEEGGEERREEGGEERREEGGEERREERREGGERGMFWRMAFYFVCRDFSNLEKPSS